MDMVVVVRQHLDHTGGTGESRVRPDENPDGPGADETVDEVLCKRPRDLRR